jgi:hypothetical protein
MSNFGNTAPYPRAVLSSTPDRMFYHEGSISAPPGQLTPSDGPLSRGSSGPLSLPGPGDYPGTLGRVRSPRPAPSSLFSASTLTGKDQVTRWPKEAALLVPPKYHKSTILIESLPANPPSREDRSARSLEDDQRISRPEVLAIARRFGKVYQIWPITHKVDYGWVMIAYHHEKYLDNAIPGWGELSFDGLKPRVSIYPF